MTIYVDNTHLGRHVTGLERITLELFSEAALAPLDVVPVKAQGTSPDGDDADPGIADAARRLVLHPAMPRLSAKPAAAAVCIARAALYP